MSRLASLDLGTNTFRMLVAEQTKDGIKPLRIERAIVRLGEGMHGNGGLCEAAMQRAIEALKGFRKTANEMNVTRLRAVGTSAFREAKNREALVNTIRKETGWKVDVISGEEEARLTAKGAFLDLKIDSWPVLLLDIGGGSTEYSLVNQGEILRTESTDLGVVHLTEGFVKHDPPTNKEISSLKDLISHRLQGLVEEWSLAPSPSLMVGVAGTPTTIAAVDQGLREYRHDLVHGYEMGLEEVESLTQRLLALTAAERLALPGMEKGREDLIVAGVVLLQESMRIFNCPSLVVSDCGLLEGILLEMVEGEER